MTKETALNHTSDSSLNSDTSNEAHFHADHYDAVPLDLPGVTEDAVSRQISRIQSRRSKDTDLEQQVQNPIPDLEPAEIEKVNSISDDPKFNRFPASKKKLYVAVASLSCFLSPLSGLSFLPAVPEIASRFSTSGEVINISSAVYCIFMSISPCIFSPISDIYGRKITFIVCSFMFSVSTILVAVSVNLAMFFIFRALTAIFGTSFFSVGAHVVADLYIPRERGACMSYIICGAQLGTAFGAVIGGIIVNYTSWRVIFWALAGIGFLVCVMAIVLLEETSVETRHSKILKEAKKTNPKKKFVLVPINPFRIIKALKYPTLVIDGYITISLVFNMYSLLTPIRYVMDPRFNLTKPVYSGLFYLAPGLGYLVGSLFGGKWADYVVRKYQKKRGRRVPEDRLRQTYIPLGFIYPVSILIYGWSVEKEKGGMAVPIIFMFISGLAQTNIFPASNTYCVDSMPELAGDAIGSSYFTRYLAAALASAVCLKSINKIGVGWTCTYSAALLWIGFLCAVYLVKYGEDVRVNSLIKNGLRKPEEFESIK